MVQFVQGSKFQGSRSSKSAISRAAGHFKSIFESQHFLFRDRNIRSFSTIYRKVNNPSHPYSLILGIVVLPLFGSTTNLCQIKNSAFVEVNNSLR